MRPILRLALLLTLLGVVVLPVAGAQATSPPTKPPKLATYPLKVTNEGLAVRDGFPVVNFGRLPVGTCPPGQDPVTDASCVTMPIDVTNVSDGVVDEEGESFNGYGYGPFNFDDFTGNCGVLMPGDSCEINVFVHVVAKGVAWTYLDFAGPCTLTSCIDYAWVRLQVEGV